MRRAIELNPWHSGFFWWLDIGSIRSAKLFSRWPDEERLRLVPDDRVVVEDVSRDWYTEDQKSFDFMKNLVLAQRKLTGYFIAGGLFGGRPAALAKFDAAFHATFHRWAAEGRWVGDDQNIFDFLVLSQPKLFAFIPCRKMGRMCRSRIVGERWFALWDFFANAADLNDNECEPPGAVGAELVLDRT